MKLRPARTLTAFACAAAATVALGTASYASPPADRHLPKVVAAWQTAWNGTDPGALGALFTRGGTYTDQAIGVTFTGRQEISGWKARTDALIENVRVSVRAAHRDGDHITIEAVYSGHLKGAPKPFAVPLATLLDLDGPRIAHDQDFYSLNAVLAQSGLPADWTPPTP
ncbi:nuclear transport factor 2 family protein [Streptomyces sp. NPDC059917]|uniref:nuclear transport factor 2 family protein n=1 Tax=Streptomyces sp. NPDC059917 TaxID=3347002 RepID=UPI003661A44C